ncbi:MAG: hydroxyethylthiazole kinase [Campylobacter sp.]|nr:hydroxyethylthiazole kinase [Campylobacter sp.]
MYIKNIRSKNPLIHCITNYVTAVDVANALIACGASPVMADAVEEVAEVVALSDALVINIGTLDEKSVVSMHAAIKEANRLCKIVVLDPVGVSISKFRQNSIKEFLLNYKFSVIKGNLSEIKFLAGEDSISKGVDASLSDIKDSIDERVKIAQNLAQKTDAIVVITGEIDIISDKNRSYICKNGNAMMSQFTGSGCILSGLIAAFLAGNKDITGKDLEVVSAAVSCEAIAGDLAKQRNILSKMGNMTFKTNLIDEIYLMNDDKFNNFVKFEKFER